MKERALPHVQVFQRVQKRGEKKSEAATDKPITMGAYFKAISIMDSALENTANEGMNARY